EEFESLNRNYQNSEEVWRVGDGEKNEEFFNLILGTDYYFNDQNVITISGNYAFERETELSDADFSTFDAQKALQNRSPRQEHTKGTNPKWQYEMQYKSDFSEEEEHFLLISA